MIYLHDTFMVGFSYRYDAFGIPWTTSELQMMSFPPRLKQRQKWWQSCTKVTVKKTHSGPSSYLKFIHCRSYHKTILQNALEVWRIIWSSRFFLRTRVHLGRLFSKFPPWKWPKITWWEASMLQGSASVFCCHDAMDQKSGYQWP